MLWTRVASVMFLILALPACSSRWIKKQYLPYRAGTVKYGSDSTGLIVEKRREDALVKIARFCGHDSFAIVQEDARDRFEGVIASSYYAYPTAFGAAARVYSEWTFIHFVCEEANFGTPSAYQPKPETRRRPTAPDAEDHRREKCMVLAEQVSRAENRLGDAEYLRNTFQACIGDPDVAAESPD